MKILISLLFSLLCFFGISQELIERHSYGVTSGQNNSDYVDFVEIDEEFGYKVVGGTFQEVINPDFNSSFTISSEGDYGNEGFLCFYNQENELVYSYVFGGSVLACKIISDSTFVVGGVWNELGDFDPRPDQELIFEGSLFGDGFLGCYKFSGEPVWVKTFQNPGGSRLEFIELYDDQIIASLHFSGSNTGNLIFNDGDTFLEFDNIEDTTILFNFNFEGDYNWHEVFALGENIVSTYNIEIFGESIYVGLLLKGSGNFVLSQNQSATPIELEQTEHLIIVKYDILDNSVDQYWGLGVSDNNLFFSGSFDVNANGIFWNFLSFLPDDLVYFGGDFDNQIVSAETIYETIPAILKINHQNQISWISESFTDDGISMHDMQIDNFNRLWTAMSIRGNILMPNNTLLSGMPNDFSGVVTKTLPNGSFSQVYQLMPISGDLYPRELYVNEQLVLGGVYNGNHYFDFNEESSSLGGSIGAENGFVGIYSLPEPETELLYNNVYSASTCSEDGEQASVDFYLMGEVTDEVTITLTPNNQLDLGNGPDGTVSVIIQPNEEAFFTLNVDAVDDLLVEGSHWGNIIVSISSNNPEFDAIQDQTVQVDIIDNEIIGVEERTQTEIIVYPNPVSNTLLFSKSLNTNTTLKIYTLEGKLIRTSSFSGDSFDVSDLDNGHYSLTINDKSTHQFVVNH